MKVEQGSLKCLVHVASHTERAWLEGVLSYRQGGRYGGKVCYLKTSKLAGAGVYFGSGLLRTVLREARKSGVPVEVDDTRTGRVEPRAIGDCVLLKKTPHYYQTEAAAMGLQMVNGVIELPTGSGKTLVTALLVEAFRGARVLFMVSDAVLSAKTAETIFEETGIAVTKDLRGQVVSTTLQTVYAAMKKNARAVKALLKKFDVLIVDEAHQVPAATFHKVCSACPAYWRIALSATPFSRSDKKSAPLLSLFGGLIYRKTEGELAREGYLPKTIIRMITHEQDEFFLGKYPAAYTAQVVQNNSRNDLIARAVSLALKPCLVLFADIKHGHGPALRLRILSEGLRCELVDARAPVSRRQKMIADLNARRLDVVVASKVFNVGVDVPELRSVVIAGGGQAVIQTVQRLGRGMRLTKGKTFFQLWDVLDWSNGFRKGRGTWIAKHAHIRMRTYRKRGHAVFTSNDVTGPWVRHAPLAGLPAQAKSVGQASI